MKMGFVLLTLVDKETAIRYTLKLSSEDANRAGTDVQFASALLRAVIAETGSDAGADAAATGATSGTRGVSGIDAAGVSGTDAAGVSGLDAAGVSGTDAAGVAGTHAAGVAGTDTASDTDAVPQADSPESEADSVYRWSHAAIKYFLFLYREREDSLTSGKRSHKKFWQLIADEMKLKSFLVTSPQCSSKMRSLKKSYKSIKDHNNKSGNSLKKWEYLEDLDDIFHKKAWCDPVAVASSSGPTTSPESSSSTRTRVGDGTEQGRSSKKPCLQDLLSKRVAQKEEAEIAKKARHEERVTMDRQLLEILQKLEEKYSRNCFHPLTKTKSSLS